MRIITRAEWGARPPKRRFLIDTPTPKLWLHHAAGAVLPGDDSVSATDLRRIRSIQDYHMDVRGWSDIAYSFLMDPDGNVFEGRGAGVAGGHTAGRNTVSHALCIMGNYDVQAVDSDLLPRIVEFTRQGEAEGWWPETFTGGHRDAPDAATSCPGASLYRELPVINATLLDEDMPLSDDDIQRFWFHRIRDVVTGADRGAAFHLAQARGDAIRARVAAETSLAIVKELANRPSDVLAPAEIDAIAAEVAERVNTEAIAEAAADELAERLAE